MSKLRYPRFTGRTEQERVRQLEEYLRYLVDALNFLLK